MSLLDDDSRNSFLKKAAALTVGIGGVVAFNKLGGAKFLSDELPILGRTTKNILNDLSDIKFKDMNSTNIKNVFNKNIEYANELYSNGENLHQLNTFEDNLISSLIKKQELINNPEKHMKKRFQSVYSDRVMEELGSIEETINTEEFEKSGLFGKLKNLVNHVIENNDLLLYTSDSGKNTYDKELVKKYLNNDEGYGVFVEDGFIDDLFDLVNVNTQKNEFDKYLAEHTKQSSPDLIENILKEYSAENLKNLYGTKENESIHQKIINNISNTRSMTLDDFYMNQDKFDEQLIRIGKEEVSVKKMITDFYEDNPTFGDMLIDGNNLKLDNSNNNIINYNYVSELKNKSLRGIAGSLIGKIARVSDYLNIKESGSFNYFKKGKIDLIGESTKTKGQLLSNDYIEIRKKMFRVEDDNSLTHSEELEELYGILGVHGSIPRMLNKMSGRGSRRSAKNRLFEKLDIGTTADKNILESKAADRGILGSISRRLTGTSRYNVIEEMYSDIMATVSPGKYRKNLYDVSSIFSNITKAPSLSTFSRLEKSIEGNESNVVTKKLLRAAQLDNVDDMLKALSDNIDLYNNKDLVSLIRTGTTDRDRAAKMLSIKSNKLTNEKRAMKFKDMIRREVFKEAILTEGISTVNNERVYSPAKTLLNLRRAGITKKEYDNAKDIAYWGLLQERSALYNGDRRSINSLSSIRKYNQNAMDLLNYKVKDGVFNMDQNFYKGYQERIEEIKDNYKSLVIKTEQSDSEKSRMIIQESTNAAIMMRKGYSPKSLALDLIKNKNDYIKQKANLKKFGMQFIAGKDTSEYITSYTMVPYFMTQRLIEPFNKFGLGLSSKHTGSVLDMWKNIGLKKVLPIAGAMTGLSYLNYRAKAYTGTSFTGAFAQGIANVDLGLRKVGDAVGIGSILDAERRLNPITQYWLGEDYQDSEERKDYYENGYDIVRKSRWWAFGSASEFRGGKILYHQPNYLKRANSSAKDIGLYGSEKEKWAHSWIPTPRHPLAPIRKLLNPYWLEKKHIDDRPYLETAPLFSTGTPWGAVLNPTIGREIKPIKKMHRNETRRGLTDPRQLIQEKNERIKAKAIDKNDKNIVRISQTGISNIDYISNGEADPGNINIGLSVADNKILGVDFKGIGYEDTLPLLDEDFNNVSIQPAMNSGNGNENTTGNQVSLNIGNPFNKLNAFNIFESTLIGSQISNSSSVSTNTIASLNSQIKTKANTSRSGYLSEKYNLADIPMNEAAKRISNRQDESDLKLTTSRHNYINDSLFSIKQLSGIYGFTAGLFQSDKRKVRPENAEKMSSFKRGFWDSNVGGLGGEVMEIARRFFPHDDRSWTDINPIRNTMPDWMPDRFRNGDPYTKVVKGEMRLPGPGYESDNKLHSDSYGLYGALDRMKILGDVAPWSSEYKLWRDIARKTVKDEKGVAEINAIKKRVEKQSMNHEFYPYKFLKTPTDFKNVVVESVGKTSFITTSGKSYKMAGVKFNEQYGLQDFLSSGAQVRIETLKSDRKNKENTEAAVFLNKENINQKIINMKAGEKDTSTAMAAKAMTGDFGQVYGALMEGIAHAPIPFIHNKLLRVDTPLESFKNERIYGTPFSTWEHPIKGFIKPSLEKMWGRDGVGQVMALGSWALAEKVWSDPNKIINALDSYGINITKTQMNKTASVLFNALNPGAFTGSMMTAIPAGMLGNTSALKDLMNTNIFAAAGESDSIRIGARIGASVGLAGYAISRSNNPLKAIPLMGLAGGAFAEQMKFDGISTKQGAVIGATAGLILSAMKNPKFDKDKIFGKYVPQDTKKRLDIEEYYDRLDYIKYTGLYKKAARKAKIFEGVDIKKIINSQEYIKNKNIKRLDKLSKSYSKISNSMLENKRKEHLLNKIEQEMNSINYSDKIFRAGKYTKAAIAYKQASESTMHGLQKGATSQQVLRAIPNSDKDYFMEFIKEEDEKKRKEILKYLSPYQRRVLQIAWGNKKVDKVDTNNKYFKSHFMPGVFWAGWNPRVDMQDVKIKTIENEGMLLSDFGIYESQKNEPQSAMTPGIKNFDKKNFNSTLALKTKLYSVLNGAGLIGVKVSVSPSSSSGIDVIANITNAAKIMEYKIRDAIDNATGTKTFY